MILAGLSNLTSLSFRRNNAITAQGMSAFAGLVNLLDEYASAAGSAVENGGQRDKRKESETPLL